MKKKESPVFLMSLLPPLLAQLHASPAIMIVLGNKATLHLTQLGGYISPKENNLTVLLNLENLMKGTMSAGNFIVYIIVNNAITFGKHHLIISVQYTEFSGRI